MLPPGQARSPSTCWPERIRLETLHAVAPLSIQLANDNWTLSFACDAYSRGETDALLLPKASEAWG